MIQAIRRINRWYDDLDRKHGLFRFLFAMVIIFVPEWMIILGNRPTAIIGLVLLGIVAGLRIVGLQIAGTINQLEKNNGMD